MKHQAGPSWIERYRANRQSGMKPDQALREAGPDQPAMILDLSSEDEDSVEIFLAQVRAQSHPAHG